MTTALPLIEPMTGGEFRELREGLGVSQEKLAHHLGLSGKTVHNIETGDGPIDSRTALAIRKLAEDAGVTRKGPKRTPRDGSSAVAKPSRKSPKS